MSETRELIDLNTSLWSELLEDVRYIHEFDRAASAITVAFTMLDPAVRDRVKNEFVAAYADKFAAIANDIEPTSDPDRCKVMQMALAVRFDYIDRGALIDSPPNKTPDEQFADALASAVNSHSRENGSDTPDHILGEFLAVCLKAFDQAVTARKEWYGPSSVDAVQIGLDPNECVSQL